MQTRFIVSIGACAALIGLAGCASDPSSAQIGTGAGAVLGGVAGDAVFGGAVGTIGGAAAGAVIGNELGKRQDEKR
ncbi:MAG TPA: glycine zipper domain-containing protein [Burkholderiaceae bacterium]